MKKVLIIPVRFTDQAGPSDAPGPSGVLSGWGNVTNGVTLAQVTNSFWRQSYGKCAIQFTVLPEINLGVSYTVYNAPLSTDSPLSKFTRWYEPGSFADDVRAKARLVGVTNGNAALYDSDNYDLDIFACGFIPGQGFVSSGNAHGRGVFAISFRALTHELAHNFGLNHGNGLSRATYYSLQNNGTFYYDAYGDVYDLMGYKNTGLLPLPEDRDANVYWKNLLGWLPDEHIIEPVESALYRLHAFDQGTLEAGKFYAARILRDASRVYWLSFRQAITNAESVWSQNGLEVRFGGESTIATSGHTTLIDMTPGSRGYPGASNSPYATMYDAPLAIGRTFSDSEAGLHVTPVKKGGTTPESLDVVINRGSFPGNVAPTVSISPASVTLNAGVPQTFTAMAADKDGDTLAYYWEFDDPTKLGGCEFGGMSSDARLAPQGSHAWTRNGQYFVRCTVTDMKGHATIASALVTVTNGAAGILTISGIVQDEAANPLAGAVVNNFKSTGVHYGATNFAASGETASDGKYIVQLPPIGAATYNLSVLYQGYSFACSVASATISVGASSVTNINFTRLRANRNISGGILVAGRAYDPATDGALTISDGVQTVNAAVGSWQMTVADGTLANIAVTPANSTYSIFNYAPNPIFVANDLNALHLFVTIPGKMPGLGFLTSGASSDDTVGIVNIPVALSLPAGSTSWVSEQSAYCWIDRSSTAEYGVDYKMAGGYFPFFANKPPTTRTIPLKIIHNSVPKNKTVVIKMGPGSSISTMGPITTFTYTISNAPPQITAFSLNDGTVRLTWPAVAAARYTIEKALSLTPAVWSALSPHTNLTGIDGLIDRNVPATDGTPEFFRIRID
ncbi:MAG TPA: PKD domain-containing protein [Verrucomicrobiae bacterium]|nr:PKD domain-containing protein [Verrucomicrobiae bacterium]